MTKQHVSESEYSEIHSIFAKISTKLDEISIKNPFKDKWFDSEDVCRILKISKRTLQNYRDKGIIAFSQVGNKIYYKASDIESHLEKNYIKVFSKK